MVDKYRIFDSPKSWRLRNGVEVPESYLAVLSKHNVHVAIVVMVFVFVSVFFGTTI